MGAVQGYRALAAAQTVPVGADLRANVDQHVELAWAASRAGASVVLYPELSLFGYDLEGAAASPFTADHACLAPLRDAARGTGSTLIVGGSLEARGRPRIAAFVLSPSGVVRTYTKRRLGAFPASANPDGMVPPPEATLFDPGSGPPTMRIRGDCSAIAICADTGDPLHPEVAAHGGARTYMVSAFVIPEDVAPESARLARYAARHGMDVLFSNFGGPAGGLPAGGCSALWSRGGELLVRLPAAGLGLAVAVEGPSGWRTSTVLP